MGYWATWFEMRCDHCKANNFVNSGDTTDFTVDDPVGYLCWSCGKPNRMAEPEDEDGDDVSRYKQGQNLHE